MRSGLSRPLTVAAVLLMLGGAAPAPSPEANAEALALVHELPSRNTGANFLESLQRGLPQAMMQQGHLKPEQASQIVNQILMPDLRAHYPELEATLARIWSSRFDASELRALRAFLQDRSPEKQAEFNSSPLGRKYAAEQEAINRESAAASRDWVVPVVEASFAQHAAELKALGIDPLRKTEPR